MQATIRQQVIYPLKCPQQELMKRNTQVLCSMSQNIHSESEIVIQNYGQTCLKASLGYDYDFFETPIKDLLLLPLSWFRVRPLRRERTAMLRST